MGMSAQKMTIKTANGQTVEIICEGVAPTEVVVVRDSIIFKVPSQVTASNENINAEKKDTTLVEADTLNVVEKPMMIDEEEVVQEIDSLITDSLDFASSSSIVAELAQALAEEYVPGYTEAEEKAKALENVSGKDVVKGIAAQFVGKETVETIDFWGTVLGDLCARDTTFVPQYEQRKPKKRSWKAYSVVDLEGSFGQNIEGVSDAVAARVNSDDYGDDTENENKYGGGAKFSRVYISGREKDGKFVPNRLGIAWSWGGLLAYSYEPDMGSYFNTMGKIGFQMGQDIVVGVDGLVGCGVTPYNTFYTNYMNHSVLNKSAFCFKYGVQVWASLNFTRDVYTSFYGRYVYSVKPSLASDNLPEGWELVVEDFDPSSWTVGLAVGYKFGAPETPSQDKRLRATLSSGYQFLGNQKGMIVAGEFDRFTHIASRAYLSTGVAVEKMYDQNKDRGGYASVLLALGLKIHSPYNRWFWETKFYGGMGDYAVTFSGENQGYDFSQSAKKLSVKAALQLGGGLRIGKCNELFGSCRLGYHFGKSLEMEGFEETSYENLKGFEGDFRLGYRYTF